MPPRNKTNRGTEPLGFEDLLWKAADKLRGSMDASEYKHVVLGLIFLKFVEDAFEERRAVLRKELAGQIEAELVLAQFLDRVEETVAALEPPTAPRAA